jgi:hypothetical protein
MISTYYQSSLPNEWFSAKKLSLDLDKTNVIKFMTKNSPQYPLNIGYNDKYIGEAVNTKFLRLQIDDIRGSGCIDLCILDLSTRWIRVISFTPWPLYPQGNIHQYPLNDRLWGSPNLL